MPESTIGAAGGALGAIAVIASLVCLAQVVASSWAIRRSRARTLERTTTVHPTLPRLSVIVPCHEVATTLPGLLDALAAQDHPSLQIIVVDDASTDGTARIARAELKARRPPSFRRIDKVMTAPEPPPGWARRGWACAVGAAAASGDHVVFLDPSTVPTTSALSTLHAIALASKAGLVTGVSAYAMPSWPERAFVPSFPMLIFSLVPLWALVVRRGRGRRLAFGHESVILVDRAAYTAAGGHAASAGSERPAIDLARAIVGTGRRIKLVYAADLASWRGHPDGLGAVGAWRHSARAYAGDSAVGLVAAIVVLAVAWILPLAVPLVGLATGQPRLTAAGILALGTLALWRVVLARLEREPVSTVVLHPVTAIAAVAAACASLVDGLRGGAVDVVRGVGEDAD